MEWVNNTNWVAVINGIATVIFIGIGIGEFVYFKSQIKQTVGKKEERSAVWKDLIIVLIITLVIIIASYVVFNVYIKQWLPPNYHWGT